MDLRKRILLTASVALLTVPLAHATLLQIDDRSESPVATVDGMAVASGETINLSFINIPGSFTDVNLLFIVLEPGTMKISDTIGLLVQPGDTAGTTSIRFGFQSDAESPLPPPTPFPGATVMTITETGGFQQIYSSTSGDFSFTIQFASDAPEPATLALLGIGLAGIGFARRRKLH